MSRPGAIARHRQPVQPDAGQAGGARGHAAAGVVRYEGDRGRVVVEEREAGRQRVGDRDVGVLPLWDDDRHSEAGDLTDGHVWSGSVGGAGLRR